MQQLIEAEELKEHCLDLLEQVAEQQETLVITRDGHAVAKLVSVSWTPEEADDRSGRVSVDDIVVPMEVAWES
jgi:antitoxin (DNA-binding transcriptional repressor) of toxin-antitoxin stability system